MIPFPASRDEQGQPNPVSIQRDADESIVIQWSDETITRRTAAQLRKACPCATCREKKRGESSKQSEGKLAISLPILSKAEAQPLRVESMSPVGSYAYQISFSDGHSSGIYPFALLRDDPNSQQK
jgi:DUF971 family protein